MCKRIRKGFVAHNPNWKENLLIPDTRVGKYMTMRPNQLAVYDDYKDERFMIVRQPPGAGKSATIKFIFGHTLRDNPNEKLLITLPQNIISASFGEDFLKYPDGSEIKWRIDPENDLSYYYESKKTKIKEFLKKKKFPKGIQHRIMICSQNAYIKACEEMAQSSFPNTTVVVDEAHHVQAYGDEETLNGLGKVVKGIINSEDKTSRLWFTTATYFRGDGVRILNDEDEKKFTTYFLPLDEYFETLKHIRSYSYDFMPYQGDFPGEQLQWLLSAKKRRVKTIIYVPRIGSLWAEECKIQTVKKLIKAIHKAWPEANILDLVTKLGRDKKKYKLMNNRYDSDIDIVLAVDLLNEGTDWPEAAQVFDLAPSNSLRVANQRFGRLLRDKVGKKHISYYVFFPFATDFNNVEDCRHILSNNFAALSASFIIEESIAPVKLPSNPVKRGKTGDREVRHNFFVETVPDLNMRGEIRQEILEAIHRLKVEDVKISVEEYRKCIYDTLELFRIEENTEEIVHQIETELTKRAIPNFDIHIDGLVDSGFDKIRWEKIGDMICQFVSGSCGKKMLQELREYYARLPKTPEEWVKIAEELALANYEDRLEEYGIV